MGRGKHTAELGRRVRKCVVASKNKDLVIFFDHGRRGESRKIVPFFGKYGTATTLANVDLAVVNKRTKQIIVACEIEESEAKPKKIIGDVFNLYLAEKVRISKDDYDINSASILVGVKAGARGKCKDKLAVLEGKIPQATMEENRKKTSLRIVTAPTCLVLIDHLESTICEMIQSYKGEEIADS